MPAAAPVRADNRPAPLANRSASHSGGSSASRPQANGKTFQKTGTWRGPRNDGPKPEPRILFQSYFKSVGPRTYAAQVKQAGTGNHFILLTEGKRDEKTGEIRKSRVIVFSEDFPEFFRLVAQVNDFVQKNPVPREIAEKQSGFWKKRNAPKRNERD